MEFDVRHLQFKHPFTAIVAGPTSSGKTALVRRFLSEHQIQTDIGSQTDLRVLWCYGQWQESYDKLVENTDIVYQKGLCDEYTADQVLPTLIVVDDLMSELGNNVELSNLFTKGSHHRNISVIFIVQNLFHKGSVMRTVSLNSHYMILLKNPRDKSQIVSLGKQLYPGKSKMFQQVYEDAVKKPYGYLCIDMTSSTPDELRLRSNIIKKDNINGVWSPTVYVIE